MDIEALKARAQAQGTEAAQEERPVHVPRPKQAVIETMEAAAEGLLLANKQSEEEALRAEKESAAKAAQATPKQRNLREAVEKQCKPMDLGELIMTGRVSQVVPILPGKLVVTYRSLSGAEEYWLDRNSPQEEGYARRSWLAYHRLAMCVEAINGVKSEPYLNDKGEIKDDVVSSRLAKLLKLNMRIIEMLSMNMTWFMERETDLFTSDIEALKNG